MKRKYLMLILVFIFLIVSGCKDKDKKTEAEAEAVKNIEQIKVEKQYGDFVVMALTGEPLNLLPVIAHDTASYEVAAFIYNSLISINNNSLPGSELAKDWEILDNGSLIIFHLIKGVSWHDGKPFTASDVVFTYNLIKADTRDSKRFQYVDNVTALDDFTVEVRYSKPYAPALLDWNVYIMPRHLLSNISMSKSSLQRHPVGTGPYKFSHWIPGKELVLDMNDNYFRGRPNINKAVFKFYQNRESAYEALNRKDVDVMNITAAQYTTEDNISENFNKKNLSGKTYTFIAYNQSKNPLSDIMVRKALDYAVPKELIVNNLDMVEVTDGPYHPGSFWHNNSLTIHEYNIEKASNLLEQSGWKKNSKGKLIKNGKPMKITVITNKSDNRKFIAELLQEGWEKLGITVEVKIYDWNIFVNQCNSRQNFDVVILAWNILSDPDLSDIWHSNSCDGGANFLCYKNGKVDELLERGLSVFNANERKAIYDELQIILNEEKLYTYLYIPKIFTAVDKRFENCNGNIDVDSITNWYVPKELIRYK